MAGDDGETRLARLSHHGGHLAVARKLFPAAPSPWIDLSTGINPWPYPVAPPSAQAWSRLPEPEAVRELEEAAGLAFQARDAGGVIAAPGTQAVLQWLPRLVAARTVGVLGFTYAEHARTWGGAGARVEAVETWEALAGYDVAVVVNPNNPDGRILPVETIRAVAAAQARKGGLLVVDEAFMDTLAASESLIPTLPDHSAVVLRSFGKIYGLAGLRLGFAVVSPDLAAPMRRALGPWAVAGPALELGVRAYRDPVWLNQTRAALDAAAGRLDRMLREAGFDVPGGTSLFRLTASADSAARFDALARAGILVRPFAARPAWLRFGLPATADHWARLEAALRLAA